jgi:hypothetical protein
VISKIRTWYLRILISLVWRIHVWTNHWDNDTYSKYWHLQYKLMDAKGTPFVEREFNKSPLPPD